MEVTRLFDIFPYQQEKYAQSDAIAGKYNGTWETFSTNQVIDLSDGIALGLLKLGLKKGDMIGIMSDTSVEWTLTDLGILKMGGIVIPIYPNCSDEYAEYVMKHAEVKLVFVQKPEQLERLNRIKASCPSVQHVYSFREIPGAPYYKTMMETVTEEGRKSLKAIQDSVAPNEMATIIYTSGTTGNPKGVMLSHNNVVTNVQASKERLPVGKEHIALSFLPMSHIFERMINYLYFYTGLSVYYAESLETIGDNLKEIKPHVFTAVPRLLEKVFDKIQAKGDTATGISKKLFDWAMSLALKWEPDGQNGFWYEAQTKMADIVYKKFRAAVGGRVMCVASGSAALQPRLNRFFNAAGIPLVEGYGLTETSPVISVGGFKKGENKVGFVGQAIDGVQVKIAEDGEILSKGPNTMMGYYKAQDKTDEVIDKDGWFHTGDIGIIDADGHIKITDRKKEMFKTSGGKYVAPQLLENKLKESRYIEQVVVIGEYRKFPGALIVPNFETLKAYLKDQGKPVNGESNTDIIQKPEVKQLFETEVNAQNEGFAKWEKVKRFELLPEELSIDGGELTPTMKVKRKVVNEKYKDQIEKIYDV